MKLDTLNIGDTVYVDSNETFNVVKQNNMVELVDLYGMVERSFKDIEQVRLYLETVHDTVDIIKNKIITNEYDYIDYFDDTIYLALVKIGKAKGIRIDNDIITNEMLGELRYKIIEYISKVTDNHVDLSPSDKEYSLGDKVSLYYDGLPVNATIIETTTGYHGLLIDGKYKVVHVLDIDSPTNYILELKKVINVE